MTALIRYAPTRGELRARRRALLVWGIPLAAIGFMVATTYATPRMCRVFKPSSFEVTRIRLKRIAYEGFPVWSMAHPDLACPRSVRVLVDEIGGDTTLDAWGHPMDFRCGGDLPPGVKGIWIRSAGPDGDFDTDDDLTSDQ
ncbi:MAG TPA: hypothetical protein VH165_28525 [Kofleriaceae bacterium]|nr:hypothetical protein [Kofleriaceae bacterium]